MKAIGIALGVDALDVIRSGVSERVAKQSMDLLPRRWNRATIAVVAQEDPMTVTVKVDAQGRVVIPQAERERLGLPDGGALELVSTPEGVLLERRRQATITTDEDGLPLVTLDDVDTVSNVEATEAIHAQRDER